MEPDPYEEEMEGVILVNEIERHWRMVFENNNGGVDIIKQFYIIRGGMST